MDNELEAIRAKRMAEMQEEQEEMIQKQEMKNTILSQVLDQEARARLSTIALTKPDKAKMVESMLIQMAQKGQIQSKIGENQLKQLLEQISEKTKTTTTVKFDRRRAALDSDDD
ncbi:hypothetical protein HELRODRAFT_155690 [Helobdella robusta]|uniref:Programmed cell death protein 5 n=1 Tax=Helobdella robusta TaxID=6412 RepID=T1ELK5_HELRO|nr:hypothetical protein HELRODRAFT_155690 [Helobdella robusta]ESO06308.1 hypothetical protein HELRODRAFT_155690 [Helobdella robusta]